MEILFFHNLSRVANFFLYYFQLDVEVTLRIWIITRISNIHKMTNLQNMLCDRQQTTNSLKNFILMNFEEQILSDCYYESMHVSYLQKNDYIYDIYLNI